MMKTISTMTTLRVNILSALCLVCCCLAAPAFSMVTEFTPTISLSEEYTDNYDHTESDCEEEFTSIFSPGFTFGFIEKRVEAELSYTASYRDHDDHSEDDAWDHDLSLDISHEFSKRTRLIFSEIFSRSLTTELRTGDWRQVDTNTTSVGMIHSFGRNNALELDYTYEFNKYEEDDADEYTSHNPSAMFTYWFGPRFGLETTISYLKREFDLGSDDSETLSGEIRLLRQLTRDFQLYLGYSHAVIEEDDGDYTVHLPSAGFIWTFMEDARISVGAGYMTIDWENEEDDDRFFLDLDVNKGWRFTPRCSLSLTGASGYGDASADAASLGFNIFYEASALLNYQITRRLGVEGSSSYRREEFKDPDVDRTDDTLDLGVGLIWTPCLWMEIRMDYGFTDFATDSLDRDDYQENRGTITISLTPSQPMRLGF